MIFENEEDISCKERPKMKQEDVMQALDTVYDKVKVGIPKISQPIDEMVADYLNKYDSPEKAAKKMIKYQVAKCATSGFITGLGGFITLPVAIPANIGSVMYVQMRMIAGIADIAGYDIHSDQVQTLVYACLAEISVDQIIKKAGIEFGEKITTALIKKIPGQTLVAINQKVGFRFITKAGEKGVINLTKGVPVIGGIVGGGFDLAETKVIANRAYKMFIEGDIKASSDENESQIEDVFNIAEE